MKNSAARLRTEILRSTPAAVGLPYLRHGDAQTVVTDTGQYIRTFEIKGRPFQTHANAEINTWHEARNQMLYGIADQRVALWTHSIREADSDYPVSGFANDYPRRLDRRYRDGITDQPMYANRLFLSIVLAPRDGRLKKAGHWLSRIDSAERVLQRKDDLDLMDSYAGVLLSDLKSNQITPLSLYETEQGLFSKPMEFLARLYNGFWQPMPLRYQDIKHTLATTNTLFAKEIVETRGIAESHFGGLIGIKEYPEVTRPGLLDALMNLEFPYILTQSFTNIPRYKAEKAMKRQLNRMEQMDDASVTQMEQITDALDDLVAGRICLGKHHLSLFHANTDLRRSKLNLDNAASIIRNAGFVVRRETLAAEAGFFAQLPANHKDIPRAAPITSRNFAALNSFHNYPAGQKDNNHWGAAIFKAKTVVGTPYYFNCHVGDLGHTAIYGMTGSGKTVLLNFILAQCGKYAPQMVAFDKDRGAEIFIRACNGKYNALKVGVPTGFNPLQLEPTPTNLAFIKDWIKVLATRVDPSFSIKNGNEVDFAVNAILSPEVPRHERRISHLCQFFQDIDEDSIAHRLGPWCEGGEHAWVFDNPEDSLALDNKFLGFDQTEFLDYPIIRTPILMYLMHRIKLLMNGQRFILPIDEGWKALDDEYFAASLRDDLKTIRKKNGLVIFATQSPADAIKSRIANTILEQTATTIAMPNPKANLNDYLSLGFSEKEFSVLRTHDLKSHKILVKQGDDCAVLKLDLGHLGEDMSILSGTAANTERLDQLRAEVGDDPTDWMPVFLQPHA